MLLSIPWLVIPVVTYFIVVWFGIDLENGFLPVPLISGGELTLSASHFLLIFTLVILFIEIIKATRVSSVSLVDHSLSTLVFVACLVLFISYKPAASATFFLITFMTLIDVVAGFSITLRSARRDVGFGGNIPH